VCIYINECLTFQGVIRDENDLEILGPEAKEAYKPKSPDPFDEVGWKK